MNKLLKGVAAIFIAIVIAYVSLIDGLIKSQLERQGSLALQAPLDIGKATFHLFTSSLTLRDVQVTNVHLPTHNLVQAQEIMLRLSLRDLLAHKVMIDTIDVHDVRFNHVRDNQSALISTNTDSATNSPQLHEALQRIQQMLNHPLASNTIDPNASITGALLANQFKPLLTQITTALSTLTKSADHSGDWQILIERANVDGIFDFGANSTANNAVRFVGTIDNITPQPKIFDVATQFDVRNANGEPATLHARGAFDNRKVAQASLHFDLDNFPIAQWELSNDPELKIVIVHAKASTRALLSLTGQQFDFSALTHFNEASLDITNGNSDIARAIADVWRRTSAFDIDLQASGNIANPALKMNSSLDVPLSSALQQLQPTAAFPPTETPSPAP